MSTQGFRFVHASNVLVDHQLRDTGPLPDKLRQIAQDATLTAFERIVDLCIEKSVQFLMLTANSFHHRDRSLRAQTALCSGLRKLGEHGIQAVIVPGEHDPLAKWLRIPNLPDNVQVFDANSSSITVDHENMGSLALISLADMDFDESEHADGWGSPLSISIYDGPVDFAVPHEAEADEDESMVDHSAEAADSEEAHFQEPQAPEPAEASVGYEEAEADEVLETEDFDELIEIRETLGNYAGDYVAVVDAEKSFTVDAAHGIAHDPGTPQAIKPSQSGPQGCTLVEVDEYKNLILRPIRVASVRWERPEIQISPETTQNDLAKAIEDRFRQIETHGGESLWLINWTVRGSGELFEALHREDVASSLLVSFTTQLRFSDEAHVQHSIGLLPDWQHRTTGESVLLMDFLSTLESEMPLDTDALIHLVDGAHGVEGPWSGRLRALATKLDPDAVMASAYQQGLDWFKDDFDDAQ